MFSSNDYRECGIGDTALMTFSVYLMAGRFKKTSQKRLGTCGRTLWSNFGNRRNLHSLRKASLEEAVKRIVGKSSRKRVLQTKIKSDYGIDDPVSPREVFAFKKQNRLKNNDGISKKVTSRPINNGFHSSCNKKGWLKNAELLKARERDKNLGNLPFIPPKEYTEFAVKVTAHWDLEFMKKLNIGDYFLETKQNLQDIYCKRKLIGTIDKPKLPVEQIETPTAPPVLPDHQEQMSNTFEENNPASFFSPIISASTPISDPLKFFETFLPKQKHSDDNRFLLEKENCPPNLHFENKSYDKNPNQDCLSSHHLSFTNKQQPFDTRENCFLSNRTLTSHRLLEDVSLLCNETCTPATNKVPRQYVPYKHTLSLHTAELNFEYRPHVL